MYVYGERWMESELDPLQVVRNNSCTALSVRATILIEAITQLLPIILSRNKEQQPKNCPWIHSSAGASAQACFHNSGLLISRTNLSENECYWCLYPYIAARNTRELQAGYLLASGTRSIRFPIHFYTNAPVLISFMTFYDVKPQLVKSCHRG